VSDITITSIRTNAKEFYEHLGNLHYKWRLETNFNHPSLWQPKCFGHHRKKVCHSFWKALDEEFPIIYDMPPFLAIGKTWSPWGSGSISNGNQIFSVTI
jgi:hypothetical protein